MKTLPSSLLQTLHDGRLVPFIGSGVSMSLGKGLFPSWPALIAGLAQRLRREAKQSQAELVDTQLKLSRLYDAAEECWRGLGKNAFFDEMRTVFDIEIPDSADLTTPRLVWALQPSLVVTTNYDSVLSITNNEAKRRLNRDVSELAVLERDATNDRPCVWHLHGHVDTVDSLVLAPSQYTELYGCESHASDYTAAIDRLRSVASSSAFLFVGFGMQDEYVMEMLKSIFDTFGQALQTSFAFAKSSSNEQELWESFGIQVIPYEDHGEPLNELLRQLASSRSTTVSSSDIGDDSTVTGISKIHGCEFLRHDVSVGSLGDLLGVLEGEFGFRWEPENYELDRESVVFWPVRLRKPAAIHAVQSFAVSVLQQSGASVVLCLDDFGDSAYGPDRFHTAVGKWLDRCGGDKERLECRLFSELLKANTKKTAWEHCTEWLGKGRYNLDEVLEICKISKAGIDRSEVFTRGTGRLLTPATVWSCLEVIQRDHSTSALLTLGGYDEKNLWESWRRCTEIGTKRVGHLYLPELTGVHMKTTDLSWPSRDSIERTLTSMSKYEDNSNRWKSPNAIIPWSIVGCSLLPEFAHSGMKYVRSFNIDSNAEPEAMVEPLAREVAKWLL